MSAALAVSGTDVIVFGGWIYSEGEKGDLYRIKCVPGAQEMEEMRKLAMQKRKADAKRMSKAQKKGLVDRATKITGSGAQWLRGSIEAGMAFMNKNSGRGNTSGAGTSKDHELDQDNDQVDNDNAQSSDREQGEGDDSTIPQRIAVPTDEEDANFEGEPVT